MYFLFLLLIIVIIAPICIIASILNWDWYFRKLVKTPSVKGSKLRRKQIIINFIIPFVILTFFLVEEFEHVVLELPKWGGRTDALIQGWIQVIRYTVHGFTLWESTADRYQELKAITGGKAMIAPVDYY